MGSPILVAQMTVCATSQPPVKPFVCHFMQAVCRYSNQTTLGLTVFCAPLLPEPLFQVFLQIELAGNNFIRTYSEVTAFVTKISKSFPSAQKAVRPKSTRLNENTASPPGTFLTGVGAIEQDC